MLRKLLPIIILFILLTQNVSLAQDPAPDVVDPLAGLDNQIVTRRSVAKLTCEASQMVVDLTFNDPFRGTILMENAAQNDTTCRFVGNGQSVMRVIVPFKGCGTTQREVRVFENNMRIRFDDARANQVVQGSSSRRSNLLLQSEERKTILCRQPPPVAPPVVNPLLPVIASPIGVPAPIVVEERGPSITEFTILIPLVLVAVLGFLICGCCCAWWSMRKRRTFMERQRSIVTGEGGSDITKLTGSTFPTVAVALPPVLKIPRAVAPPSTQSSRSSSAGSSAASEANLVRHLEGGVASQAERSARSYASSSGESLSVRETYGFAAAAQAAAAQQQQQQMTFVEYSHVSREAPPPVPPPPPPPPAMESDRETLRSYAEYDRTIVPVRPPPPRPPPPPPPPPPAPIQIDVHEADHESISVIESLENEIVVTATRKPPSPLLTETQTVEFFDNTKRSYTKSDQHQSSSNDTLTRRAPPPRPTNVAVTTSQTQQQFASNQQYTTSRFNEQQTQQQQQQRFSARPPPPPRSFARSDDDEEYASEQQERSLSTFNTMQHVRASQTATTTAKNEDHLYYRSKPAPPLGPTTNFQQQNASSSHFAYQQQQTMKFDDDQTDEGEDRATPTPHYYQRQNSARYRVEQTLRMSSPEPTAVIDVSEDDRLDNQRRVETRRTTARNVTTTRMTNHPQAVEPQQLTVPIHSRAAASSSSTRRQQIVTRTRQPQQFSDNDADNDDEQEEEDGFGDRHEQHQQQYHAAASSSRATTAWNAAATTGHHATSSSSSRKSNAAYAVQRKLY